MKEITHDTYIEALEIVKKYHQQKLGTDSDISKAHKKVEQQLLKESGTVFLLDFLLDHCIPRRVYTSIVRNFRKKDHLSEWTVEYFLSMFLSEVQNYGNLGWMKGVSAKTMTEFLNILSENGFREQVKPFEEYMKK